MLGTQRRKRRFCFDRPRQAVVARRRVAGGVALGGGGRAFGVTPRVDVGVGTSELVA
jgi:hypothetical protein